MDAGTLHILLTATLGAVTAVMGWLFVSMINNLKESIVNTRSEATKQVETLKTDTKAESDKLWNQIGKVESNHADKFDKLNETMHEMKDTLINEIRNIEKHIKK